MTSMRYFKAKDAHVACNLILACMKSLDEIGKELEGWRRKSLKRLVKRLVKRLLILGKA